MEKHSTLKELFYKRKYLFLFIALLLPYLFHPFKSSDVMGISILDISFTLLIYVAIFTVGTMKKIPYTLLTIALVGQFLTWSSYYFKGYGLTIASQATTAVFLVYIGSIILHRIILNQDVTSNTIFAALCIYLLMALSWAFIYSIIYSTVPNSFYMNDKFFSSQSENFFQISKLYYFIYFSFCTITTLGFGDIIPAVPISRMCASLEAMGGQLYLMVLVSRLVSMHINNQNRIRHLTATLTQGKEILTLRADKTK